MWEIIHWNQSVCKRAIPNKLVACLMKPVRPACNDMSISLMCYASHLVIIFLWARLSPCVFQVSPEAFAQDEGYMTEGEGRCHSQLFLLSLLFPLFPDCLLTEHEMDAEISQGLQVWVQFVWVHSEDELLMIPRCY